MIEDYFVGGIIYFRRNIESLKQVSALSNDLQMLSTNKKHNLPLIKSTDQEGGAVNRLIGGTHFPGNMLIGATRQPGLAEKAGRAITGELQAVWINMDLAPVLDVSNNPLNISVGSRSFGGDPVLVADLGAAFIKGMQGEGIIACAKHFPGHGDTIVDSHLDLPVIECNRERLEKVEIYPFKAAIEAGADIVLISHSLDKQKAAIDATIKAVKEGRITEERIDQSVLRILGLKRKRIGL